MPVSTPPAAALAEFLGATTRHTRRVEIYESDAVTRWDKDVLPRLKSGSVSVDYDRDERRTLDLTLSNQDQVLINAPGEFWYDKIIKVFRGVQINQQTRTPKIVIITDLGGESQVGPTFRQAAVTMGYGNTQLNLAAAVWEDIADADIVVGLGGATMAGVSLMAKAYMAGKTVLILGADAHSWANEVYPFSTSGAPGGVDIVPLAESTHPVARGWSAFNRLGTVGVHAKGLSTTSVDMTPIALANNTGGDHTFVTVAAWTHVSGGRAVTISFPVVPAQFDAPPFNNLIKSALAWLDDLTRPMLVWETQIGEFMIDRISEPNFPYDVKITGRDYTKKCMLSKYTEATQFIAGMSLESIIAGIAGSAGIVKRNLPATGIVVQRTFFWDRGTSRWEAMKEVANAHNYELYFDATGYLTMRPYQDPASTSPVVYIKTGKDGQLASYEKTTSDTRLFNSVIVVGESSDASVIPVYAKARNTNPDSPTCIQRIGERLYEYSSSFIRTQAQAQTLADSFLAIHSLEEFELNFDSLMLPWLEAGDIMGWVDPRPSPGDPTTFLLSNINIGLDLAPMSASVKRVSIVG